MNNIMDFYEYGRYDSERTVYDGILNEKNSMNKGIRGFFNRLASSKVMSELEDEIEMSKGIMEGIKEGLESLNENFDAIKKGLETSDEKTKGEKEKALEEITKIIEKSRENTWDLRELIDEGEIDYTGFTANIAISSIAYFGILLTPFRAVVMIHKGYNYFFNIIKNTIRKALVMLQVNFDQFENLIITKGFQSAGYLQTIETNEKITEFYMQLETELVGKGGLFDGKKNNKVVADKLRLAKQKADEMRKNDKAFQQNDLIYNCLDSYNNTYTKSLEMLRQYSSDDVQKHLDAIKTTVNKLAGQEADLQVYGELILAAAEEHAYKVSSSIYSRFAKMTEVFSLPNQKKLIDLIQAANNEKADIAKKERKARKLKKKEEEAKRIEDDGLEIFKKAKGSKIGDMDSETRRFPDSSIDASGWTYDKFSELSDDDQETFETWLMLHPEVLKKCAGTLRVSIYTPYNEGYHAYIDSLIDYIAPCIKSREKVSEDHIPYFSEFIILESGDDRSYIIDFTDIDDIQANNLKAMYGSSDFTPTKKNKTDPRKRVAMAAFNAIGKKVLNDNTFIKNSENIIDTIRDGIVKKTVVKRKKTKEVRKKKKISTVTYEILRKSIDTLKDMRDHDYANVESEPTEKKKSEK